MSPKLRRTALSIVAASCGLALTACGGDSDEDKAKDKDKDKGTGSAAAPSLVEAKEVVLDYMGKFFAGDAGACVHESAKYAAAQDEETGSASCEERVAAMAELVGDDGTPLIDVSKTVVTVNEPLPGQAVADVVHEIEGSGGVYYLVVQDGVWVIDGEMDYGDSPSDEDLAADKAQTAAWSEAFCQVELGATEDQVLELMGEPTTRETDDDGETELGWQTDQAGFYVWIGEAGNVSSFSNSGVDACEDDATE